MSDNCTVWYNIPDRVYVQGTVSTNWQPTPINVLDLLNQLYDLKRKVDVIYEALKLLLGEDLEKAIEKVEKDETAKRSETAGQRRRYKV